MKSSMQPLLAFILLLPVLSMDITQGQIWSPGNWRREHWDDTRENAMSTLEQIDRILGSPFEASVNPLLKFDFILDPKLPQEYIIEKPSIFRRANLQPSSHNLYLFCSPLEPDVKNHFFERIFEMTEVNSKRLTFYVAPRCSNSLGQLWQEYAHFQMEKYARRAYQVAETNNDANVQPIFGSLLDNLEVYQNKLLPATFVLFHNRNSPEAVWQQWQEIIEKDIWEQINAIPYNTRSTTERLLSSDKYVRPNEYLEKDLRQLGKDLGRIHDRVHQRNTLYPTDPRFSQVDDKTHEAMRDLQVDCEAIFRKYLYSKFNMHGYSQTHLAIVALLYQVLNRNAERTFQIFILIMEDLKMIDNDAYMGEQRNLYWRNVRTFVPEYQVQPEPWQEPDVLLVHIFGSSTTLHPQLRLAIMTGFLKYGYDMIHAMMLAIHRIVNPMFKLWQPHQGDLDVLLMGVGMWLSNPDKIGFVLDASGASTDEVLTRAAYFLSKIQENQDGTSLRRYPLKLG